jgi:hypothetical protein
VQTGVDRRLQVSHFIPENNEEHRKRWRESLMRVEQVKPNPWSEEEEEDYWECTEDIKGGGLRTF